MSLSLKDKVAGRLLASNEEAPISGQELADALGVSRTAVWKCMKELEAEGYEIGTIRKKGYFLVSAPDAVDAAAIGRHLETKRYGRHIVHFDSCPSTQTIAHDEAQNGVPDGALFIAEEQTAGRGRLSRAWDSAAAKGVWMSIVIRPRLSPQQAPQMTLVAAVAIVRAIEEVTGLAPAIKWPNDILVGGKKVTGILTELQADMDRIKALIIGIGLNANQEASDFPVELADIATSLRIASGKQVDRAHLVAQILYYLELYTGMYEKHGFSPIKLLWEGYSSTIGKRIRAVMLNETVEGVAEGISEEGLLQMRLDDGTLRGIYSADIQPEE